MKSAQRPNLQSLNSVFRVIDWAGRTGEMEYVIDLATVEGLVNVDLLEFKPRVTAQMFEVGSPPGQQVIYRNHGITFTQQRVTQVGTEETGTAGDQSTQFAHEWLAFRGGALASSGGVSGVVAGRPTL